MFKKYLEVFSIAGKIVNTIMLLSIGSILIRDLWLINIPAPFKELITLGNIYYQICLTYITSYVFYVLTVCVPELNRKITLRTYIHNKLIEIWYINYKLMLNLKSNSGNELNEINNLTDDVVYSWCEKIKISNELHAVCNKGTKIFDNWYTYLAYVSDEFNKNIEDILELQDLLDNDIIHILLQIKELINKNINITESSGLNKVNLTYCSNELSKLNRCCLKLKEYTNEMYAAKVKDKNITMFKKKEKESDKCYSEVVEDLIEKMKLNKFNQSSITEASSKLGEYVNEYNIKLDIDMLKTALDDKMEEDSHSSIIAVMSALFGFICAIGLEAIPKAIETPTNYELISYYIVLIVLSLIILLVFCRKMRNKRKKYLILKEVLRNK